MIELAFTKNSKYERDMVSFCRPVELKGITLHCDLQLQESTALIKPLLEPTEGLVVGHKIFCSTLCY